LRIDLQTKATNEDKRKRNNIAAHYESLVFVMITFYH
jgi:hypothetical protein